MKDKLVSVILAPFIVALLIVADQAFVPIILLLIVIYIREVKSLRRLKGQSFY